MKKVKYLIVLWLLIIMSSCVTLQKCENKFGKCGNVETSRSVEYRDSVIYKEGAVCIDTVTMQSIIYQKVPLIIRDTFEKVVTTIDYNRNNNTIAIKTVVKRDTIIVPKIIERIKTVKQITTEQPSNFWKVASLVLGVLLLFATAIILVRR